MTRAEREDLFKVCRLRAKVAKTDVVALAAKHKAEFEKQLATIYSFDDHAVWKRAKEKVDAAVKEAREIMLQSFDELHIPHWAAPDIGTGGWYGRGENAVASRRAELRKVAYTKIDQMAKEANAEIDRRSADTQTNLLAAGLESAEAQAFLEAMPTAAQLMPAVSLREVQKQLELPADESDPDVTDDSWRL